MLGENVTPIVIEEPPSHTKRETDDMETKEIKNKVKKEKVPERPTRAIPILIVKFMIIPNPKLEMMSSPSTIKLTDTTFEIQIPQPTSLEEAEKIRLDPKIIISAKAGEKFKKAQDDEHQVLKKEHS
ncbi:hypothetical protein Tco_1178710 [Tanacetum coccineum]